nr:membralin isoform X1 [Leptinotarsa decemlineata]
MPGNTPPAFEVVSPPSEITPPTFEPRHTGSEVPISGNNMTEEASPAAASEAASTESERALSTIAESATPIEETAPVIEGTALGVEETAPTIQLPAIEVTQNTQRHGPFPMPNRIRNNNHIPLFSLRNRLFHTLFYRSALAYARIVPRPFRRFLEFVILLKAIAAFFVLVYIHISFSRTPSTCLAHVKDSWPRDGILRVEIVRNAGNNYNIEQSYAKEEKLKQGKAEDFVHVIGLLAREGFMYIEPTAVEETTKETQPLDPDIQSQISDSKSQVITDKDMAEDSLLNVSGISPTVWRDYDMLTAFPLTISEKPEFLDNIIDRTVHKAANSTKILDNDLHKGEISETVESKVYPEDEYIVEFSLEFGFLRLSPSTRARLKIPVEIVTLDPDKDPCFGDAFSRLILAEFLGYDDLLLASIKTLAEQEDNKGYLRLESNGEDNGTLREQGH